MSDALQLRLEEPVGTASYAETDEEKILARYLDYSAQEKYCRDAKEELGQYIKQDVLDNGTVYRIGDAQANVSVSERVSYDPKIIAALIATGDIPEKIANAIKKSSSVTTLRIGKPTEETK